MKKMNLWMLEAILTTAAMMTSCIDNIDNAAPQGPTPVDPLVEHYVNDSDMDRDTLPGESFYYFSNGAWMKSHDESDQGLIRNSSKALDSIVWESIKKSDDPLVRHLLANFNTEPNQETELALFWGQVNQALGDDQKTVDLTKGLGRLNKAGYTPLIARTLDLDNTHMRYSLTAGSPTQTALTYAQFELTSKIRDLVDETMKLFITDEAKRNEIVDKVYELELKVIDYQNGQFSKDPEVRRNSPYTNRQRLNEAFAPRRAMRTGVSVEDMTEAFGLDIQRDVVDEKATPYFNYLAQLDNETLYYYIVYYLYQDYKVFMPGFRNEKVNDKFMKDMYSQFANNTPGVLYPAQKKILSPLTHDEEVMADLEELRKVFAQRIRDLDWMSNATKEAASDKLSKMLFEVGVPKEKLMVEGAFNPTGKSPLEDYIQCKRQNILLEAKMVEADIQRENFVEIIYAIYPLTRANASYWPNYNGLIIYPFFCSGDLYPVSSNSDEELMRRYATIKVFGHEMTHGFDSSGSEYDAVGQKRNWWADSDLTKFKEKQGMMIELFNQLWAYEGQHADGQKTLTENMADMGGLRLAFETYKNKMTERGYSGESLKHMLREFFLHYAQLWKMAEQTPRMKRYYYINDVHSLHTNRVDGQVRLFDEWYDLFSVKSGTLFVDPAQRPKIW